MVTFICRKLARGHCYIPENIHLTGKTIIITGAASGIGRVSAIELAKLGAKVIVGIRGKSRSETTAESIRHEANVSDEKVIGYNLDLSDLSVVKAFADEILSHEERIDILLNNAGTMQKSHLLTADGFESQFGTNHMGHFYLTKLLLPLLIRSEARVINVSSMMHCVVDDRGIDYEFQCSPYRPIHAYAQSKLAQIWHACELQERFGCRGISAYSVHPGAIMTSLTREMPPFILVFIRLLYYLIGKSPYEGALTSLYCCLSKDVKPGEFYADCKQAEASPIVYNKTLAEECWNFSEKMINEKTH
ncbi:unnamed protein product [Didymodactylos carnosus]|uniref:Retinol dehydrogenase 12 n=1 Tax=Didymodactylos carnosus TaxID=1234261 RepID=A0A813Y962_9BILA|nr:unnamed protein product [Didymodactylos carnosus]CAF0927446.1 unnamed protein product [Didymodactylos carnosus]CAF3667079.1 unnamed protein product [Didymodactylos carnosus]CAF3704371.1 unnamed protein product [Didymodactylos carnosus]